MVKEKRSRVAVVVSLLCALAVSACHGNSSSQPTHAGKTASAKIFVNILSLSKAQKAESSPATVSDITAITVDVSNGSTAIATGQDLTCDGGVWSGVLQNLPIGPTLTFVGHAYDASTTEIFRGTAFQVMTGSDDAVTIVMAPLGNGSLTLPMITQITLPSQIVVSTTVPFSAAVQGSSGEVLSYTITPANGGGVFTAQSGTVQLSGTTGAITATYSAPATAGTYTHTLTVTNSQGNWTASQFTTNIVDAVSSPSISMNFLPVVTSLGADRSGSEVTLTASVSDDGPQSQLTYQWSFDGGATFQDSTTNPAVLQGYTETMFGTLGLTVTDQSGQGGSTHVSLYLPAGAFPDFTNTTSPVPLSSDKAITTFSILGTASTGTINESTKTIFATVPYGVDVTALVATFATTGVSVSVNSIPQTSGVTPNDFTSQVLYTVTAQDGSTATYTVTIGTATCSSDAVSNMPLSGSLATGPGNDFVALCNGTVLLGDTSANMIREVNIVTGPVQTFQLTTSPGDLKIDRDHDALYMTQAPAKWITRLDLKQNTQAQIAVSSAALHLAVANDGDLFASLDDSLRNYPIALISGLTQTVTKTFTTQGGFGMLIAFDKINNQLIAGVAGYSPSALARYSFDPVGGTLTLGESLSDAGSNGLDIAMSPAGGHVAFAAGAGNGSPSYTIYDFSSTNLNTVYGAWNTTAYPTAVDFDSTGQYLLASNRYSLQVFSVATHAKLKDYTLNVNSCNYADLQKVRFSPGGKIVYAFFNCGFNSDSGRLFWFVLN